MGIAIPADAALYKSLEKESMSYMFIYSLAQTYVFPGIIVYIPAFFNKNKEGVSQKGIQREILIKKIFF